MPCACRADTSTSVRCHELAKAQALKGFRILDAISERLIQLSALYGRLHKLDATVTVARVSLIILSTVAGYLLCGSIPYSTFKLGGVAPVMDLGVYALTFVSRLPRLSVSGQLIMNCFQLFLHGFGLDCFIRRS